MKARYVECSECGEGKHGVRRALDAGWTAYYQPDGSLLWFCPDSACQGAHEAREREAQRRGQTL